MPSDTITVRFDRHLYNRIKNHWMCTSDIIRNAAKMYLDELDEEEKQYFKKPNLSDVSKDASQVKSYSIQDENSVKYENIQDITPKLVRQENNVYPHSAGDDSIDGMISLMDKLKNEMEELDFELERLMNKYK